MKRPCPSCKLLVASASILAIAGCGGGPGSSPSAAPVGAATSIYLAQNNTLNTSIPPQVLPPQVLQFPTNASGNPSPPSTISFAANATITAIATDASGNIYVASSTDLREYAAGSSGNIYVASSTDLREYAAGSSGTATPIRLIPANATTTLGSVTGLTVDASGNIYAAEEDASQSTSGIAVFSSTANGSVAPTRYILGASQAGGNLSTLQIPGALATDSSGNLYVVNGLPSASEPTVIDVFSPTAAGNVAPIRIIGGALVGYVQGIAIDSADNLYTSNNLDGGSIYVYANGATGNATPTRSITQIGILGGLTVDSAANVYLVWIASMLNQIAGPPEIMTFSPSASGTTTPASSFTPRAWTGPSQTGLAVN